MRGCHSCPVQREIASGKYTGAKWEAVPCSTCDAADALEHVMEYDDRRMPVEMDDRGAVDGAAVLPVDVMQEFVTGLLRLRPELRDVVALRYSGMTYRSIAERQGVTVAAVEKRHRQAMAEWPELKALFPRKIAKQQTRRPHRRAKSRVSGGGLPGAIDGRNRG